jgi:hypothetical protein
MKKQSKYKNSSALPATKTVEQWNHINEPNHPSCKPTAKWSVRYRHVELTNQFEIEIRFRTRRGARDTLIVPASERSDFDKIRRELCARDARLPEDRKASHEFVVELIRAAPKKAVTVISKPGFRDGGTGFVMPTRMYGTAKGRFVWDDHACDPTFGEVKGQTEEYSEGVLKPALASPFLSFAILTGLAALLPSYVGQKDGLGKLVPENAVFHVVAESSSGKTIFMRLMLSVFGSPEMFADYQATDRGAAEICYARNDLVVGMDDTETAGLEDRELFLAMKRFGQVIGGGRSKAIAKNAARSSYPSLTYSCFGVSTGPETLAELGRRLGKKLHGLRVRFIDLPVPQGGIFTRVLGQEQASVEDPGAYIVRLEAAIAQHHGVLMDAWIPYLLSDDHSARIRQLVNQFVEMTATGENGLEVRFARKFGVVYAAGLLAIEAGLLPWSVDWVTQVMRYCYELARTSRDPDASAVEKGLMALAAAMDKKSRFVRHTSKGKAPVFPDSAVGLKITGDDKVRWFVCRDRLKLVGVKDARIQGLVIDKAKECGFIVASKNSAGSDQFRVESGGKIEKPRFWRINRKALQAWAQARSEKVAR